MDNHFHDHHKPRVTELWQFLQLFAGFAGMLLVSIPCQAAACATTVDSFYNQASSGALNADKIPSGLADVIKQLTPGDAAYKAECVQQITTALQERVRSLNINIEQLQNMKSVVSDATTLASLQTQIGNDLTAIDKIAAAGVSIGDLVLGFDDYPKYYYYFFGGIQFTSVNTLFENGYPTVGFNIYHQLLSHFHLLGSISLASSAEQQASKITTSSGVPPGKKSLEFDIDSFMPIDSVDDIEKGSDEPLVGPIAVFGARKTDDVNQFDYRRYIGLRSSLNPDTYFDVMYGKTSSLSTPRYELRAQMPLPILMSNTGPRFYIGAIANIRAQHTADDDSLVIYLTWNIPFTQIYSMKQQ